MYVVINSVEIDSSYVDVNVQRVTVCANTKGLEMATISRMHVPVRTPSRGASCPRTWKRKVKKNTFFSLCAMGRKANVLLDLSDPCTGSGGGNGKAFFKS